MLPLRWSLVISSETRVAPCGQGAAPGRGPAALLPLGARPGRFLPAVFVQGRMVQHQPQQETRAGTQPSSVLQIVWRPTPETGGIAHPKKKKNVLRLKTSFAPFRSWFVWFFLHLHGFLCLNTPSFILLRSFRREVCNSSASSWALPTHLHRRALVVGSCLAACFCYSTARPKAAAVPLRKSNH